MQYEVPQLCSFTMNLSFRKRLILLAIVAFPAVGVVAIRELDDRPHLATERAHVVTLVETTASHADQRSTWHLDPSKSIEGRIDSGSSSTFEDFDRCDYWWNMFLPGYQTGYALYQDEVTRESWEGVLGDVSQFWESLGYAVAISDDGASDAEASVKLNYSQLSLTWDRYAERLVLMGTTECLPKS